MWQNGTSFSLPISSMKAASCSFVVAKVLMNGHCSQYGSRRSSAHTTTRSTSGAAMSWRNFAGASGSCAR